jgi:histidine triad (HIT) family protein
MPEMNEEQRKALMEKLKNMSPEELREFQKKQCVFCQIIGKKMEAKLVYEDDLSVAILDINPANAGHVLLMPKEHYAIMPQVPEEEMGHLGIVTKKLSLALLKSLKAQGTTVFVANGVVAGQRAQHLMIHIIPRSEGDGVGITVPQRQISDEELDKLQEAVGKKVNEIFGIKKEVVKEKKVKEEKKPDTQEVNEEKEDSEAVMKETIKSEESAVKEEVEETNEKEEDSDEENASLDDIAGLFR